MRKDIRKSEFVCYSLSVKVIKSESDLGNFSASYRKLLLQAGENTDGVQFIHRA